jgi:hypothetical protein
MKKELIQYREKAQASHSFPVNLKQEINKSVITYFLAH